MKYITITTLTLLALCSNLWASNETSKIDYKDLSQVLVKVSAELANATKDCGDTLKNVSKAKIENGFYQYNFDLQHRGIGRLGGTIYKACKSILLVDVRPTYYDGPAVYSLKYKIVK